MNENENKPLLKCHGCRMKGIETYLPDDWPSQYCDQCRPVKESREDRAILALITLALHEDESDVTAKEKSRNTYDKTRKRK